MGPLIEPLKTGEIDNDVSYSNQKGALEGGTREKKSRRSPESEGCGARLRGHLPCGEDAIRKTIPHSSVSFLPIYASSSANIALMLVKSLLRVKGICEN